MAKRKHKIEKAQKASWPLSVTVASLLSAVASFAWALSEPGFESFVAAISVIGVILIYFGLKSRRHQEYLDISISVILLIIGITSILFFVFQEEPVPDVDIAYFQLDENNNPYLVDPQNVEIVFDFSDVESDLFSIPINLAVLNKGVEPLEIVRVELSYDKSFKVIPGGSAKIDPENRLLIYEHDIGYLDNRVGSYTPLRTIDIVKVPFDFGMDNVIALTKDGVPMNMLTLIGYKPGTILEDANFEFGITVYSKNNEPVKQNFHFTLSRIVNIFLPSDGATAQPQEITATDLTLFNPLTIENLDLIDHWIELEPLSESTVEYLKYQDSGMIIQRILIDSQVRRVNVDTNGDGNIEYELYDTSFDGIPDGKILYLPSVPMIEWYAEAVR